METHHNLPICLFESQAAWATWLEHNHTQQDGLWLKIAKKSAAIPSVTYAEALDEALCNGWIDSQKASYDDTHFLQKFTPRRSKSMWSKVNVEKIAVLTKAGRMKPTGIAAVEAAKLDGRWDKAYESSSTITMPPDFKAALAANPQAKEFYSTLNKSQIYAFLWRIHTAKKPETRQARIEKFIDMLARGEKIHYHFLGEGTEL